MTFLNPAVLFGLLAASIPIVLHFLNLRKLKKIEFSTLAFLKELQKTKIKRIRLKQWLLLLLRIVIILLLVMAFARPTVKNIMLGNSSTAKTTAVIIFDNTFSMSVVTDKGSYLNQAKQTVKSLLDNFQDGDEIALIFTGDLSNEIPKPTTNFKQLLQSIDELQISSVSKTINESIIKAAQVLYQSKNFNKEIYLLTDLQKGSLYNSKNELTNLSGMFNESTRMFLVNTGGKDIVNLGVEELIPNNQIFEKGKTVSFSARVKNYSSQSVNNSVASLFVNGKRSAQQSLNFTNGETKEINFETTLADTGLVEIYTELEDDDILQDNKRYFSVYVPDKISLLILTDLPGDAKFINLAVEDPQQKIKISAVSTGQLHSLNLKNYDAVIVIGSENNFDWKNLTDYLESGGRAVVMPGSQSTLQNFQRLCNALNVNAPSAVLGTLNSQAKPAQIDKIDFQNPLFADLFENKKNPQIESPNIYYYFKIVPGSKGKNIISMIDNSSFLSEYKIGSGKVFLFNSAPDLSWNNFPLKGFFAPMINKLILYSSSKIKEQNSYVTGNEITADISSRISSQIIVEKPGGGKEYVDADSLSNKNYFSYRKTDEPGTYKFYSGNKLLDYIYVNTDPRESVTQKESDSDFKKYLNLIGFDGKLYTFTPNDDFSKVIYQSRFGTELWKYFLIFVLLLAIIESIIARSSKKDITDIQSS
ncbi:MAG: BatA and WFA domain-containing protein [Ignavibacteriales bacterium]|nr:BatA and WFA domain-containing protein [Ignavibacteriales bacterium]